MTFIVDVSKVSKFLQEVVEVEIMPRFRALNPEDTWYKEVGGLVTVADINSELFLSRVLVDLLPGSLVLGEEGSENNEQAYQCLAQDAPVWIIDPLDGTNNFSKGKFDFAVIVALCVAKDIKMGWIYAPMHKLLVAAELGEGCWSGGERLRLGSGGDITQIRGSLGRKFRNHESVKDQFSMLSNASCCGMEYLDIVTGKLDFAHFRRLKPWDHAAGNLIVREAGGISKCLDGTAYQPGDLPNRGLLSARNQDCWDIVVDVLDPIFATLPN